jgi:hypothetical protein
MKRKGYMIEQIADPDNLRSAYWKAQRGKSTKRDVVAFRSNFDANIRNLSRQLLDGSCQLGNYNYFTIYDPKRRVICAAAFDERVVHHAIMNVCAQDFENRQSPWSYACRKGRGTFAALEQAARNQRRYKWHLKLDARKYFDSIDHAILFAKLQRMYKDPKLLDLFRRIIDSYHASDDKGLPIGNLTSQYFANHYLSFADKYAVEQLRIPAYIRYMDDMLLWSDDRVELSEKGRLFEQFIHDELQLLLKPPVINKTAHGLPALGFLLKPNQIRLNRRSRTRYASKLKTLINNLNNSIISEQQFAQNVLSLYGFISHATNAAGFSRKTLNSEALPTVDSLSASQISLSASGSDAGGSNRVNRGGSWNNNARNVRVSNRNNNTPDNRNNNLGFRLACSTKLIAEFEQASEPFPS